MKKGLLAALVFLPLAWAARAATMQSATNVLYPGDDNSGGEDGIASVSAYTLGDALGEAAAGSRMTGNTYQMGGGLRQIMAYPDVVTDLAAGQPAAGIATMTWTSPGYDGAFGSLQAGTSYYIALATFTVASPFSSFNGLLVSVSTSGVAQASAQAFSVTGLTQPTYYVRIWTVDADGNASFGSNVASFSSFSAAIASFMAASGLKEALLTWTGTGASISAYHVYRSLNDVTFVDVATTTAPSFIDRPLISYTSYYYKVAPVDSGGAEGPASPVVQAVPYTLPPLLPTGIVVVPTSNDVTVSWSTTTHFSDGTVFYDTASPASDELQGYQLYRSTSICAAPTLLATLGVGQNSHTDVTGGLPYFYQVKSYNSLSASTATVVFDSLGSAYYVADDCQSKAIIPDSLNKQLSAGNNGYGEDIAIIAQRRPQDTGGEIIQSVSFTPLLGGHTPLANFHLPSPATIQLHYLTSGGRPVPQNLVASAAPAGDLGMYWNNGAAFQKMYGKVDTTDQIVDVESPNLGVYQIRTLARSAGPVFDVSNLASRVITPNGDGLNDTLIFTYDPGPNNVVPTGQIFDLKGRQVADMTPGAVPNTLTWDGRMNGRYVTSGVYIYQIKGGGQTFNGTFVVAR